MAAIKYAQILSSYCSQEGVAGVYTNYTYYTLLIVYMDGSRQVKEGKIKDIAPYIGYLWTSVDEIAQMQANLHGIKNSIQALEASISGVHDSTRDLQAAVRHLRTDVNELISGQVSYAINSLYPLPKLDGLDELTAEARIKEQGMLVNMINTFPEGTPRNGVVTSAVRSKENFRVVDVEVKHTLPNVVGMDAAQASEILTQNGFRFGTVKKVVSDGTQNSVLSCEQVGSPTSLWAKLTVANCLPELVGRKEAEVLPILEERGFSCTVTPRITSEEESGTILDYTQNGESADLEITVARNLVGMDAAQASEILTQNGFRFGTVKKVVYDGTQNSVLSCEQVGSPTSLLASLTVANCLPELVGRKEAEVLPILEERGFFCSVKNLITNEEESGTILDYTHDGESTDLEITVARNLPNVVGRDAAQACEILQRNGFSFDIEKKVVTDGTHNAVLSCQLPNSTTSLLARLTVACCLPKLEGRKLEEVLPILEERGFRCTVNPVVTENRESDVILAYTHSDESIDVGITVAWNPSLVVGSDADEAAAKLEARGFDVVVLPRVTVDQTSNTVLEVSRDGSGLYLTLIAARQIPDVRGMKLDQALTVLEEQGYLVEVNHQLDSGAEAETVLHYAPAIEVSDRTVRLIAAESLPDGIGKPFIEVEKILRRRGFEVERKACLDPSKEQGTVLAIEHNGTDFHVVVTTSFQHDWGALENERSELVRKLENRTVLEQSIAFQKERRNKKTESENELDAEWDRLISLRSRRAALGVFASKERKNADEEIEDLTNKLESLKKAADKERKAMYAEVEQAIHDAQAQLADIDEDAINARIAQIDELLLNRLFRFRAD